MSKAISMSYVFLKNIFALVLLLCFTTSCAVWRSDVMVEAWVDPTPVDKTAVFPGEQAMFDERTPSLSRACRQGALTGKNIRSRSTWREYAATDYCDVPVAEISPDGKRKTHKLYLTWIRIPSPDLFDFSPKIQWDCYGFSFTVQTNDEDSITECSVTKQYLGRGSR